MYTVWRIKRYIGQPQDNIGGTEHYMSLARHQISLCATSISPGKKKLYAIKHFNNGVC